MISVRSSTSQSDICVTFDDGPTPELTAPILDLLARFRASATFFVRGAAALRHHDLVCRALREGHCVGNHTMTHRDLTCLSTSEIASEIGDTNRTIRLLTGQAPRYFRPPYGRYDDRVLKVAADFSLEPILWSVCPREWRTPGAGKIVDRILHETRDGSIILLHDGCGHLPLEAEVPRAMREQVLEALPRVFERLLARGYRLRGRLDA
jgi:chitooligosaccharide deacetylase